jgi:hypothetical protein
VARDPSVGVRRSGFSTSGKLVSWIRDPRNPEGDVAAWVPGNEWSPGGVESGDRHLGARGLESQAVDIASGDIPSC